MKNFIFISLSLIILSACSQTKYVAHVAKKIPMPQDIVPENIASTSVGHFKVGSSYVIKGKRYYPTETYNFTETGSASWYGPGFHGKQTANGEIFDENELTAAHRTLQLPSIIQVTNLENGRQVVLRVNDRGPFAHERILDVSKRGAELLGFKDKGVAKIRLEVLADASKEVASMARNKQSTKGMEIAYNNSSNYVAQPAEQFQSELKYTANEPVQLVQDTPVMKPVETYTDSTASNARIATVQAQDLNAIVQNAVQPNATLSAAEITQQVAGGKQMYVQAGAFSQEANAHNYSSTLASLGPSYVSMTSVQNQPFFRVRLGPFNSAQEVQGVLNSLSDDGNQNAVLIIE